MARASSMLCTARSVRYQTTPTKGKKNKRFFFLPVLVCLTLAIVAALSYVNTQVRVVDIGYKINQEVQKKENLIEDNKRLSLEIAQLKSPTRIESEAREKLGLKLPEAGQIVYLAKLEEGELARNLAKIGPQTKAVKVAEVSQPKSVKPGLMASAKKLDSTKSTKKNPDVKVAKVALKKSSPKNISKNTNKIASNQKNVANPKTLAVSKSSLAKAKGSSLNVTTILVANRNETNSAANRHSKQLADAKPTRNVPATLLDPIP